MGTGKSTVGRELARLLGRQFVDMDAALEKRFGKSVNNIFAQEGEEAFRIAEQALAEELAASASKVVATGGGTVMDDGIRARFRQSGVMICLMADRSQLLERLERTSKRPLLAGGQVADKVDELLEARQAVYGQISIRVDTTNLTPQEAAKKILDLLRTRQRILDQLQHQYIVIS